MIPGYDYSSEFRTNYEHTQYNFVEYKGSYTISNISENKEKNNKTEEEDKEN